MFASDKIRISGDGTMFSRTCKLILLSKMEPSIGQYLSGLGKKVNRPTRAVCLLFIILSVHAGNHTIAAVKGI